MTEDSFVLDCWSTSYKNGLVFLLNHNDAFMAYHQINKTFDRIGYIFSSAYDSTDHSHLSLLPFVMIMQRQAISAFEAMASHRSFDAWVLARPCVESALIIGKWVDDVDNAAIWRNKEARAADYRRVYSGKGLVSKSLPRSGDFQKVLSRINDDFMHTNYRYYDRHTDTLKAGDDGIQLVIQYFDTNAREHLTHLWAFLHLLVQLQGSLLLLQAKLFPSASVPEPGIDRFQTLFRPKVETLIAEYPEARIVLSALGVWKV